MILSGVIQTEVLNPRDVTATTLRLRRSNVSLGQITNKNMSDNKSKRGWQDRSKVNINESYEKQYLVDKYERKYPDATHAQVQKAVVDSAKVPQFHQSRKMIENSIDLKLKNL